MSNFNRKKNLGFIGNRRPTEYASLSVTPVEDESPYADPLSLAQANDLQEAEAAAAALEIANKNRPPARPTASKPYGGSRSRRLRTKRKSKLLTKRRRSRQSRTKRRNLFGGVGYNCTTSEVQQGYPNKEVVTTGPAPPIFYRSLKPVISGGEPICTQQEINERRKYFGLSILRPAGGYKRLSLKTKQKSRSKKSRK